jgi:hypothetical protein
MEAKIDSREVRIGNYLQDRKGRICIVERLEDTDDWNDGGVQALSIDSGTTSLPVEGIPITKETLYKLGFEDGEYPLYYAIADVIGDFYFSGNFLIWKTEFDWVIWRGEHVHELQNVIFACKGIDLELKR